MTPDSEWSESQMELVDRIRKDRQSLWQAIIAARDPIPPGALDKCIDSMELQMMGIKP